MKMKGLLVCIVLIMVMAAGCSKPAEKTTEKTIKLGASLPLSGPFATFGEGAKYGFEAAIADINKSGGVLVKEYGKKLPVELVVLDNESDSAKASSTASDLILRHGAIALLALGSPIPDIPISSTADRYKTPLVTGIPFEPWWAAGPYNYAWNAFFRIATPLPAGDPRAGVPGYTLAELVMSVTNKYKDQTNKKVAIFATDDNDGRAWYGLFPDILKKQGYTPVGFEKKFGLVPPGTVDFSSIIREWKNEDAQIMWANCPPPDMAVLLRQMEGLGYKPKVIFASRALLFNENVKAVGGNLAHGVMAEHWWYPAYPPEYCPGIGDTTAQSLAKRYTSETGRPLNLGIGVGYSLVQIMLDAIERAGKLDKEAINQAMAKADLKTINGYVKFTDTHDSPMPAIIVQWVKPAGSENWEMKLVHFPLPWLKPEAAEPIFPLR